MRRTVILLALLAAAPLFAASTEFVAGAPSQRVLEGSSNVTGWRCRGVTLNGQAEIAAGRIEDFELQVPVKTLRCGNRQMERDMYRALRSGLHPEIEFRFTRLLSIVNHTGSDSYTAKIAGELSLAGATRSIDVDVEAERIALDRFRLRARLPLRMTDFRIKPPTALFGMVRAKDDLVVQFDLVLQARYDPRG